MRPVEASRPRPKPIKTEPKPKPKAKAAPAKKEAKKKEEKKGLIDRWAEKNDGNGLRANSVKSFADLAMMAKGGRDVRTEKYQFGPWNISKNAHKTVAVRNNGFTRGASGLGGVLGAYQLKAAGASMVGDLRAGFRQGWNSERRNKAIGSTASFASVGLNTAKSFAELREARKQVKDVTKGFRSAIDKAANRTTRLHANPDTAAHYRHQIRTKAGSTAKAMAKKYVGASGDVSAQSLKKIADTKMKRAVASGASKAMASQGLKAAKVASKAGGRFIPGANVAIAAADTAAFYSTMRDKNASVGKKVTAGITAAGSVLAATNIPVVSQVGAAVSTVSSVVGAIGPAKVGHAVKDGAKKVFKKLKFW